MDLTLLLTALGIIIAVIIGAWQIYLAYKQIRDGENQRRSDTKVKSLSALRGGKNKPADKKKDKLAKASRRKTKNNSFSLTPETLVRLDIEATETMFYHAAQYKHEVGGTLIGVRVENEIYVKRANIGLETDFDQIDLATGEVIVGFWHSHTGSGVFISATDKSVLISDPILISVIIDPLSKNETMGAYGIINKITVRLKISTH